MTAVLILYLLLMAMLTIYGLHCYYLAWRVSHSGAEWARRITELRTEGLRCLLGRAEWPRVLVQIPIYNEPSVVERCVRACAGLDYPPDRLTVQVLDDSTDSTREIADRVASELRAQGRPVEVLRRNHRAGFKAGALADGLAESDAEFVAIFDADFSPPSDFLRRAVPLLLADARAACVQGRWEHVNRWENLLTRAQALGIDGHFSMEQLARCSSGWSMNFNGSVGVWRASAIHDAGGWSAETLTEDLDLSYRAQLRGWTILYDNELACPGELPSTLAAFKSQQQRWACGSIQTARKLFSRVWSSEWSLSRKVEAMFHLFGYAVCPAMLILALMTPAVLWTLQHEAIAGWIWPVWGLVWFAALGPSLLCLMASRWLRRPWRCIRDLPLLVLFGTAMCWNNTIGVMRALTVPFREFVRTPKSGGRRRAMPAPRWSTYAVELLIGVTLSASIALVTRRNWYCAFPMPVLLTSAFWSLGCVGFREAARSRRQEELDDVDVDLELAGVEETADCEAVEA
ncbi:MAG: glycosyltransferase [Verrucomicrobiae bacterium]|nr:glycosyltransferase [Verrucomicrobiae bacterium]